MGNGEMSDEQYATDLSHDDYIILWNLRWYVMAVKEKLFL
jgi:hypothetical protein